MRNCAAGAAGALCWSQGDAKAVDYDKPVPGSDKLTAYQTGAQVLVRWGNMTLAAYRALPTDAIPTFTHSPARSRGRR